MTRVLVPSGALGLGFDDAALKRGVELRPDIIAIDGGSTDSGPSYLGRGVSKYSAASTKIEWRKLIEAQQMARCPLVIGSAGTCGTDGAVDWLYEISLDILAEQWRTARIVRLYAQQDPEQIARAFTQGALEPLPGAPTIDAAKIRSCTNIVALAGVEQIQQALAQEADIIIAGRTTDTAIIAALPLMRGAQPGAAWHGAKIAECGALCSTRPSSGVIAVDFDQTGFTVLPLAEGAVCTPHTVSAHMLYENANPFCLVEPGGVLDVSNARYVQTTDGAVRVEGAIWTVSDPYCVKLEGACLAGYQTISLVTLRDQRYVEQVDAWCGDILQKLSQRIAERTRIDPGSYKVELRQIGRDSTLGPLERSTARSAEIGVIAIITAKTQEDATEIAKLINPYLLHHALSEDEPMPTFAFMFSPPEIERGAIYNFTLNHIMPLQDPMQAFRLVVNDV